MRVFRSVVYATAHLHGGGRFQDRDKLPRKTADRRTPAYPAQNSTSSAISASISGHTAPSPMMMTSRSGRSGHCRHVTATSARISSPRSARVADAFLGPRRSGSFARPERLRPATWSRTETALLFRLAVADDKTQARGYGSVRTAFTSCPPRLAAASRPASRDKRRDRERPQGGHQGQGASMRHNFGRFDDLARGAAL
jgi:hypothetical protein